MPRRFRFALTPGWVLGHLLVLAACVIMALLGHWQLDVSDAKHFSLQNFGYALQWWAFTAFTLLMWLKIVRDHAGTGDRAGDAQSGQLPQRLPAAPVEPPVAYRRYVMPQSSAAPAPAADATHAAYNDYLARLADGSAARDQARASSEGKAE